MINYLILTLCLLFLNPKPTIAYYDPLSRPNNMYGIHIVNDSDLEKASKLVNSEGGEWGYVKFVIREDEMDLDRFNKLFSSMKKMKLIPIVRIATTLQGDTWDKFDNEDIDTWLAFLDSLDWPIRNRYIMVGNEPNHATEWGGIVNPEAYANFLKSFSIKAKAKSSNFFILNAGLDASSPDDSKHMSIYRFIHRMSVAEPDIFDHIDGWASHSYPNPNFSGSSKDSGLGSIRSFESELSYLKSLGLERPLPVFITETGWAHDLRGSIKNMPDYGLGRSSYKTESEIANELVYAFTNVWNQDNIVAILPFVLNYDSYPFETFSWVDTNGEEYEFYSSVSTISKIKGEPEIISKIEIAEYYEISATSSMALIKNISQEAIYNNQTAVCGNVVCKIKLISSESIPTNEKSIAYLEVVN